MSKITMDKDVIGQLKETKSQLDIEWDIPDFLSLSREINKSYQSPMCFFHDTAWFIKVYPNCLSQFSPEEYIGICVGRGMPGPPVTVTYNIFIKTTDGKKAVGVEYTWNITVHNGVTIALARSELINNKSKFMPSGTLTVICSLKFNKEREVKDDQVIRCVLKSRTNSTESSMQTEARNDFQNEHLPATPEKKFVRDYKELLLSGDGSDVTLQVKGQKFEVHRAFLRARSSVFASMLTHNMKENNTGMIDIVDCDPEYFSDFLHFLYCGNVGCITSQNVCSLYRAADKYDVQDLKSECLEFMKSHLDVDNFCDVITLALQHGETDLIKLATDFFAENMLKIVVTVKWQVFLHENTTQGNELIIKGLSANKSSNT